jgi:hypothetical protein
LDPIIIESHAIEHLARALNLGHVIAVVGSGVSAAYGYVSWSEMLSWLAADISNRSKAIKDEKRKQLAEEALRVFQSFALDDQHQLRPGIDLTLAFQLCETASDTISEFEEVANPSTSGINSFRDRARTFFRDPRARAAMLISDLVGPEQLAQLFKTENLLLITQLKRLLRGDYRCSYPPDKLDVDFDKWSRAIVYEIYSGVWLQKVYERLSDGWLKVAFASAIAKLRSACSADANLLECPLSWGAIEALLRTAKTESAKFICEAIQKDELGRSDSPAEDIAVERRPPMSVDPLAVLHSQLGIRRYMTTNYDLEIERLFNHLGYRASKPAIDSDGDGALDRIDFSNALGQTAFSKSYNSSRASDLLNFAVKSDDAAAQVVHLHGHAITGSRMAITEPDYKSLYALEGRERAGADSAMALSFKSNPLLFVGLGMEEPEILNPLRSFAKGTENLADRPCVALMPKIGYAGKPNTEAQRALSEKAKNLSRYGIYTVHYGLIWKSGPGDQVQSEDFLARATEHIEAANSENIDDSIKHLSSLLSANAWFDTTRRLSVDFCSELSLLELAHSVMSVARDCNKVKALAVSLLRSLRSSIFTKCLCGRLLSIELEWKDWHSRWTALPNVRKTEIAEARINHSAGDSDDPKNYDIPAGFSSIRIDRHVVVLRHLDAEIDMIEGRNETVASKILLNSAPSTDRFFAGAPSPAFQTLKASLANNIASPDAGRRIFLLLAGRGVGQGHLFAALGGRDRFRDLCDWLRIRPLPGGDKRIVHFARLNLGLSNEIISVFDRLSAFLFESYCFGNRHREEEVRRQWRLLYNDRRERLLFALRLLAGLKAEIDNRIIVAINHANLIFDKAGRAKNAQVGSLFEALIDKEFEEAPIDFIFLMNEQALPLHFRRPAPKAPEMQRGGPAVPCPRNRVAFKLIEPREMPVDLRQEFRSRLGLLDINLVEASAEKSPRRYRHVNGDSAQHEKELGSTFAARAYVHVLRGMRPEVFALRFFPRAGMTIARIALSEHARGNLRRCLRAPSELMVRFGAFNPIAKFQHSLREQFSRALEDTHDGTATLDYEIANIARRGYYYSILYDIAKQEDDFERAVELILSKHGCSSAELEVTYPMIGRLIAQESSKTAPEQKRMTSAIVEEIEKTVSSTHEDFKRDGLTEAIDIIKAKYVQIRSAVGNHRFGLTVLLAVCEDILETVLREEDMKIPAPDPGSGDGPRRGLKPYPPFANALEAVDRFISSVSVATAGVVADAREDIVLEKALEHYRRSHADSKCWPFNPAKHHGEEILKKLDHASPSALYTLQEALIQNLSMIGQPVEADILVACPEVASAASIVIKSFGTTSGYDADKLAQQVVERVLDLLVHRCLIFRLKPKFSKNSTQTTQRFRFSVHKSVRRFVYARFDAPMVDYLDVDQVTVSLFPTHPNDLPLPNEAMHARMHQTVASLIRFEDQREPLERPVEATLLRQKGALRAAFGIVRSIYSCGVISRFNVFSDELVKVSAFGHLGDHRYLVRWMLQQAVRLDARYVEYKEASEAFSCFYPEEVVWLANECGVISLVQGRLGDAHELLSLARLGARRFFEAKGWGPIHARIGLNQAICLIELGDLRAAQVTLDRIRDDEGEHESLRIIAFGYGGLISHLRGDYDSASSVYSVATDRLASIERFRAASIFARHWADLLRAQGADHVKRGHEIVDKSVNFAANGGHEDARNFAKLARLKLHLVSGDLPGDQFFERLSSIDRYATRIGLEGLRAEVAIVRAAFALRHGEGQNAFDEASRSLVIANRNAQKLRIIGAIMQISRAMEKMNHADSRSNLLMAMKMASQAGFFAARDSAESIFRSR